MPVSGNSVALKSYQSLTLSGELINKVVEAVKAGEKEARSAGIVKSFEVFYTGLRQNIAIGRVFIVPVAVCDKSKEFPVALLYGTIVRELNLGEEVADLISHKLGDSEFDEYSKADFDALKELFKGEDGKPTSLILYAPYWSSIREYVAFKFTSDDEKLVNLLRHLVFGCYTSPQFSSAFDALMTTVDTTKLNVTDITPKLTYPFISENPLREYPDFVKQGGWVKGKIFLTAKTADAITKEVLEPQEMNVFEALDTALTEAAIPSTMPIAEVGEYHDSGSNKGNAEIPEIADIKESIETAKTGSFEYEDLDDDELIEAYWDAKQNLDHSNSQSERFQAEGAVMEIQRELESRGVEAEYFAEAHVASASYGDGTEVRRRPDYGEKGSYTQEANEENEKTAASHGSYTEDDALCEACHKPHAHHHNGHDADFCRQCCPDCNKKKMGAKNCTICGKPVVLSPSAVERARRSGGSPSDYTNIFTTHAQCELDKREKGTSELMARKRKELEDNTVKIGAEAPFETPFTNVGPGTSAADHANPAIAVKVDSISIKGDAPIGIAIDETGVPRRSEEERKVAMVVAAIELDLTDDTDAVSSKSRTANLKREQELNRYATRKKADVNLTEESIWDAITEDMGVAPQVSLPGDKSDSKGKSESSLPKAMTSDSPEKDKAISTPETEKSVPESSKSEPAKAEKPEGFKSKMFNKDKEANTKCECESGECAHGSNHCDNTAMRQVKTIYGTYLMCRNCDDRLPADYKKEGKEASKTKTALHYMNSYDMQTAQQALSSDPLLQPVVDFLIDFKDEVDSHSDGWAYWRPPVQAADQLMTLIESAVTARRNGSKHTITADMIAKALRPIKAFMTKRGIAAGMTMPSLILNKRACKSAGDKSICWEGYERKPGTKPYEPGSCVKKADGIEGGISEAKAGVDSPATVDSDIKQPVKSVEEAAKVGADVSGDFAEARSEVEAPSTVDSDIKQPVRTPEEAAKVANDISGDLSEAKSELDAGAKKELADSAEATKTVNPEHFAAAGDEHDEEVEMSDAFGDLADLAANLPQITAATSKKADYTSTNFKSKKEFKEAVERGEQITIYSPGFGNPPVNGRAFIEGPHYPQPHRWYAQVEMKDGIVVKVR